MIPVVEFQMKNTPAAQPQLRPTIEARASLTDLFRKRDGKKVAVFMLKIGIKESSIGTNIVGH